MITASGTQWGKNINITYKPDGAHIPVGNRAKDFLLLLLNSAVCVSYPTCSSWQLFYNAFLWYFQQVNEIAWNMNKDMFFLTTGNGENHPKEERAWIFSVGSGDSSVSLWDIKEILKCRPSSHQLAFSDNKFLSPWRID